MPGPVYQFGDLELDCGRFELLRNGKALRVERKPMELLILLASRQGQLVMRAEIAERLWSSEVFVDTEHGINTAIRKLRHLLRDDADEPKFIQTVTGMGYRFVAAVSVAAQDSDLTSASPVSVGAPENTAADLSIAETTVPSRRRSLGWYLGVVVCALVAFGGTTLYRYRQHSPEVRFTQLTDFTDSAVQPALSPDGRMVAFIRGGETFMTSDPIYVKMLPDGEPRKITDDRRPKYGLAFSPDGSELAYTVIEGPQFSTYKVSVLGGDPQLLIKNAAGLVWLGPERLLFSEAPSGIHLGVVSATATRADLQQIYSPAHERGMAHYSFPSPDRRWALIAEMNGEGYWAPCRLVALEGQHESRVVGPAGGCTAAGWSPDGHWMYFIASVRDQSHVWEERFPEGEPEQLTFGPTEENGLAVEPTGRSLITSVGTHASSMWVHDPAGDRSLSSEGEVLWWPFPLFSPDGRTIYFLLRRSESAGAELWRAEVGPGKSAPVFPGVSMSEFDLSPDGKQVVYTTESTNGGTELWLAAVDRNSPAMKINITNVRSPRFGGHGQILFQRGEGSANYLEKIEGDGSKLSKVSPYPISDFQGMSPGRRWALAGLLRSPQDNSAAVMAIPVDGGTPRHLCLTYCQPKWSIDGNFLLIAVEDPARPGQERTLAIPVGPGEVLPDLPATGIAPNTEPGAIKGTRTVDRAGILPGRDLEHYAWVNTVVHRNLYRLSLP